MILGEKKKEEEGKEKLNFLKKYRTNNYSSTLAFILLKEKWRVPFVNDSFKSSKMKVISPQSSIWYLIPTDHK